jgi:hypothetical protein
VWEALLAIADLAAGDLPQRARDAAVALSSDAEREDDSPSVLLLSDIRSVFDANGTHAYRTADLIAELALIEESPWGDWFGKPISPQALGKLLKPHRIRTMPVWIAGEKARGYKAEQFDEAWRRVLGGRGGRDGRDGSSADAASTASTAHNTNGVPLAEWLARDGIWRSLATDPPTFPSEVVATRAGGEVSAT